MNWDEYINEFNTIVAGKQTFAPYDNNEKIAVVKLNFSRMKRWLKKGEINTKTRNITTSIKATQKWILITEPWCGDAAHIAPFLKKITDLNPRLDLKIQLRDGSESEIDSYLTDGSKAMPLLIVRDENDTDLFVWGPRTADLREFVAKQKIAGMTPEEMKEQQQFWYNQDTGTSLQHEIGALIRQLNLAPSPYYVIID